MSETITEHAWRYWRENPGGGGEIELAAYILGLSLQPESLELLERLVKEGPVVKGTIGGPDQRSGVNWLRDFDLVAEVLTGGSDSLSYAATNRGQMVFKALESRGIRAGWEEIIREQEERLEALIRENEECAAGLDQARISLSNLVGSIRSVMLLISSHKEYPEMKATITSILAPALEAAEPRLRGPQVETSGVDGEGV